MSAGNWFCLLVLPNSSPHHHLPHPAGFHLLSLLPSSSLLSSCFNFYPSSRCCCSSCSADGGPCRSWPRPTGALEGSFPLMTRRELEHNYQHSIHSNPHPVKYLFVSGGVSRPHSPRTIILRRDILSLRYIYKVFLAGKSPNIRSYTVQFYGSGQLFRHHNEFVVCQGMLVFKLVAESFPTGCCMQFPSLLYKLWSHPTFTCLHYCIFFVGPRTRLVEL